MHRMHAGSPRPANVNETGEILAAWCFIHMTRQDKAHQHMLVVLLAVGRSLLTVSAG